MIRKLTITPKERLTERLAEEGFQVENIDGVKGYNRRRTVDCLVWEASATTVVKGRLLHVFLESYDTITECARNGVNIVRNGIAFHVSAKKKTVVKEEPNDE